MAAKPATGPRVAIIRNYSTQGQWGKDMLNRICNLVHDAVPGADIKHYQPVDGGDVPNSPDFDLVILTGGTWDLTEPVLDPWVAKIVDWVQETSANCLQTKVLGICWGHQVVSFAMGGKILLREGGTLIDVEDIPLTSRGQEFFGGRDILALHKFHKRVVIERPKSFQPLGERAEILLSDGGQFLTFQAHPEMTPGIAHQLFDEGDGTYRSDPTPEGVAKTHKNLDRSHDGEVVFSKAMNWAFEPLAN